LLGTRFETYELFISLIFKFFSGRGTPRITETADTESADMGARLYMKIKDFWDVTMTVHEQFPVFQGLPSSSSQV
jgi:hypothetical protein